MKLWKRTSARGNYRNVVGEVNTQFISLNVGPVLERTKSIWRTKVRIPETITVQKNDILHIEMSLRDMRNIIGATTAGLVSDSLTPAEFKVWNALTKKLYGD